MWERSPTDGGSALMQKGEKKQSQKQTINETRYGETAESHIRRAIQGCDNTTQAKRDHVNAQIQTLGEHYDRGETRKFFRGINAKRKGYQDRVGMCRNRNGQIVMEKEAVLDRWAEYFEEVQ